MATGARALASTNQDGTAREQCQTCVPRNVAMGLESDQKLATMGLRTLMAANRSAQESNSAGTALEDHQLLLTTAMSFVATTTRRLLSSVKTEIQSAMTGALLLVSTNPDGHAPELFLTLALRSAWTE